MRSVADELRAERRAQVRRLPVAARLEVALTLGERFLRAFQRTHRLGREAARRAVERRRQLGRQPCRCATDGRR